MVVALALPNHTYVSFEGGFSIVPNESGQLIEKSFLSGAAPAEYLLHEADVPGDARAYFVVYWYEVPVLLMGPLGPQQFLSQFRDGLSDSGAGKVVLDRALRVGGVPCRDFRAVASDSEERDRFCLKGKRLYEVTVSYFPEYRRALARAEDAFIGSFGLTGASG